MEIKVGDLVWHDALQFGTVLKVKKEKCAIYWYESSDKDCLNADYHVKYVRQWKRNVEDKCSVSSTG